MSISYEARGRVGPVIIGRKELGSNTGRAAYSEPASRPQVDVLNDVARGDVSVVVAADVDGLSSEEISTAFRAPDDF